MNNTGTGNTPWGVIRSLLMEHFSFSDIKKIVGYADIDMLKLKDFEQQSHVGSTKSQLLTAIDQQVYSMEHKSKDRVASICCEEMVKQKPALLAKLERVLSRVGWKFSGSEIFPVDIFDVSELNHIPDNSHEDILKAALRLKDGDLSGSLSSSCGALDSVTDSIYREFSLGDPTKASFQEKIKKSIDAIGANDLLNKELEAIGWDQQSIKRFSSNLEGSLNQAAFVMQKLRSDMGDVHGTKLVLSALAYDSIKWSLLLLRILVIRSFR